MVGNSHRQNVLGVNSVVNAMQSLIRETHPYQLFLDGRKGEDVKIPSLHERETDQLGKPGKNARYKGVISTPRWVWCQVVEICY
jgi:hypothetical protein